MSEEFDGWKNIDWGVEIPLLLNNFLEIILFIKIAEVKTPE